MGILIKNTKKTPYRETAHSSGIQDNTTTSSVDISIKRDARWIQQWFPLLSEELTSLQVKLSWDYPTRGVLNWRRTISLLASVCIIVVFSLPTTGELICRSKKQGN